MGERSFSQHVTRFKIANFRLKLNTKFRLFEEICTDTKNRVISSVRLVKLVVVIVGLATIQQLQRVQVTRVPGLQTFVSVPWLGIERR